MEFYHPEHTKMKVVLGCEILSATAVGKAYIWSAQTKWFDQKKTKAYAKVVELKTKGAISFLPNSQQVSWETRRWDETLVL